MAGIIALWILMALIRVELGIALSWYLYVMFGLFTMFDVYTIIKSVE